MLSLVLASLLVSTVSADLTIKVTNNCPYTIWPAVSNTFTGGGFAGPGGWEARSGDSKTLTVPSVWNGRIWPRRGCSFDSAGNGQCLAGDCGSGHIECGDARMGWANLVEMNLQATGTNLDWWDISAVPGFVAPITVTPNDASCAGVACTADLNPNCPNDQMRIIDNGDTIGCLSACMAGINAGADSSNCCSGRFLSHAACRPENVDYYDYFKQGCENAYAYPRDDGSGLPTVVYTCPSSSLGYTIDFC
ncbi:hypothetical protein JCM10212_003384 [Sporobolomyces blumeae]